MLVKLALIFIFLISLLTVLFSGLKTSPGSIAQNFTSSNIKKEAFPSQPLTLGRIFQNYSEKIPVNESDQKRVIIATGDIIPARSVNSQVITRKDFTWPYLNTADVLKDADITFVNLESPLVKNCPITNEGMTFCGDEGNLQGLIFAGVDVVNLANNHAGNYGLEGIENTAGLLSNAGILVTGRNEIVFKDIRGLRFAFLGYNDIGFPEQGLAWAKNDRIITEIKSAKTQADIVVVAFHWGVEYISQPSQRQKELAHLAIDNGADLIIGNHPHWIQPVEIYQGKVITYAHGNFIFDQMWSEKTRLGVVGKYTFYDKDLIDVEFLPVQIDDYGQPYFLQGSEKENVLMDLKQESLSLKVQP